MSGPDLTPPPDRELPAIEQRRAALVRELRARRPSRRLRRRNILLLPAGLLVTAGAAWAAGVFSAPVKNIYQVDCRAGTQPRAHSARLPSVLTGQVPGSATTVCLQVPAIARGLGYMRAGKPRALIACRGERAVVVPGEDAEATCARMGMEPLSDEAFRKETRRQIDASRLVTALVPDPYESGSDEVFDCIQAETLQRRAQAVLDDHDFKDFRVRPVENALSSDCASEITIAIPSDGRTFRIIADGGRDSAAHEEARFTLAEPACRRLQQRGRRAGKPGGMSVLIALECVDAKLLIQRGHGLRPAEAPAAVRRHFRLDGRKTVVKVPPGRGVPQFASTSVDRHTITIGFDLRPIVAPGPRRRDGKRETG